MTKIEQLGARFETDAHKSRQQGGRSLMYIDIAHTIERLNQVFKTDYSTEILDTQFVQDFVFVKARVSYIGEDGKLYYKDGIGADKLMAADPDKSLKTAYAEAIKKAAHQLGVALYLWDEGERKEIEQEQKAAKSTNKPNTPPPGNAMDLPTKLEAIKDRSAYIMDSIVANKKKTAEVKSWCEKNGIPANAAQMTDEQFIKVVTHIFNGKVVVAA